MDNIKKIWNSITTPKLIKAFMNFFKRYNNNTQNVDEILIFISTFAKYTGTYNKN